MSPKFNLHIPKKYILASVLAAPFLFSPAAHAENQNLATISVTATGTATLAPDMATVRLDVTELEETAQQALSQHSKKTAKVLAAMRKWEISEKDIETSSFNVSPFYTPSKGKSNSQPGPSSLNGYFVRSAHDVHVRDLSKLGEILDEAASLGVDRDGRMYLSNSNPDTALEQARNSAVAKAFAKAQTLSNAAGVKLGQITKISEGKQNTNNSRIPRRPASSSRRPRRVSVASKRYTYSVTVTVEWEIAQ